MKNVNIQRHNVYMNMYGMEAHALVNGEHRSIYYYPTNGNGDRPWVVHGEGWGDNYRTLAEAFKAWKA